MHPPIALIGTGGFIDRPPLTFGRRHRTPCRDLAAVANPVRGDLPIAPPPDRPRPKPHGWPVSTSSNTNRSPWWTSSILHGDPPRPWIVAPIQHAPPRNRRSSYVIVQFVSIRVIRGYRNLSFLVVFHRGNRYIAINEARWNDAPVRGGRVGPLATANGAARDAAGSPYQPIIARNVFGLRSPPPPPSPEANKPPPPKIFLQGITTFGGVKRALLKTQMPPKPGEKPTGDQSFILAEGQRDGDIEVLEIKADGEASYVKVNDFGTITNLTFENNGIKGAPGPVPRPGMPPRTRLWPSRDPCRRPESTASIYGPSPAVTGIARRIFAAGGGPRRWSAGHEHRRESVGDAATSGKRSRRGGKRPHVGSQSAQTRGGHQGRPVSPAAALAADRRDGRKR